MMRTRVAALAVIALVGLVGHASAQGQCEQLTRMRSKAAAALNKTVGVPMPGRCESYTELSIAWAEIAEYASDHRESCDVSTSLLETFEKRHQEMVKARDNVCSGRPARPFPPDIIQR
jgi:hypothetical protein